jgi:hypothetical protein
MSDLESVASISFALANLGAEPTPKGVSFFSPSMLISVAKVASTKSRAEKLREMSDQGAAGAYAS